MWVLLASARMRTGFDNTAALATAAAAPGRVTTVRYDGLAVLSSFNSDQDGDRLSEAAAELRRQIAEADAVLFTRLTGRQYGTIFGRGP